METLIKSNERTLAGLLHGSTFARFFIPLGNFIFPFIIWYSYRKQSVFLDHQGKQALNFQISLWIYGLVICFISATLGLILFPTLLIDLFSGFSLSLDWGFAWPLGMLIPLGIFGVVYVLLGIVNVVYTILAILRALDGNAYEYPLAIKIIK